MTTLSDTPTPIELPSESGGVSIKIEQGVLYENSYDEGSKIKVEMRDVQKVKHESNQIPATENIFNGMDDYNMLNITHSIFQPDLTFKTEPAVDIDDSHPEEETEENKSFKLHSTNDDSLKAPRIRLTPTTKLIASPNGVSGNKRRYFCTYDNCTKSYGKSSHLRSHLTWHTGIKPFVCKEAGCGKGFTRSDELNRHKRTHTGEKPFACVHCTKKFSRSDHLTKHLATHSKQMCANNGAITKKKKMEKIFSNSTLKSATTSGTSCSQEMSSVTAIRSTLDCLNASYEESLSIKQELPEHNRDNVLDILNQEQKVNPSSSFPAQGLVFANDYNLVVKPEPIEQPQFTESPAVSTDPDDDAIMPEANLPPISQNATYMPVDVKAEKSFLNYKADSVYDPTRPFPCSDCAKNFKRQDDLNRHMRTHTGEKPFACSECDKRFMRSDHLKKHLRTHTKAR